MLLKTTVKLNERTTIEATVEGKDIQDAVAQARPLLDFQGKCGLCGKHDITVSTRTAGEGNKYKYTEYVCNDCGARQQFGALQAGGFFLKEWQPKYQGNQQ
jgi:DNA-directed RNA polymerase subunit M/transcription elongation factor TFIIS